MHDRKVGIIGAGRLGCSAAMALFNKGFEIAGVFSKSPESQNFLCGMLGLRFKNDLRMTVEKSDIIFITVPDSQIPSVAGLIAKELEQTAVGGKYFLHMSGALTSQVLEPIYRLGGFTGSLHPIQTVADREKSWKSLEGIFFGFEGCDGIRCTAENIVGALNGRMLSIKKEDKPLYHAAACIMSNYMVTIAHAAGILLEGIGIDAGTGVNAFAPLLENTINNIKAYGSRNALTGPVSRGDYEVVRGHIEALSEKKPDMVNLYKTLGLTTTEIALDKGSIDREVADNLRRVLL